MAGNATMMENRVLGFILKHNLILPGSRVLVAVSGGPDSVALMHILNNLRGALDISLVVAHLDHGIRGEESAIDAQHVAGLAQELNLPFSIGRRDVEAYRKAHRQSLEEAAREVRYAFFSDVAFESQADVIATGHTCNDNVETILMHLIRGSGTLGIKGLSPLSTRISNQRQIKIVRPLLEVNRDEIQHYCDVNSLKTRHDSTNLSLSPLRNRIRLELLPLIKSYNPKVDRALLRLADIAGQELDYLQLSRDEHWNRVVSVEKGMYKLDKLAFIGLHPALKRSVLRRILYELAGSLKDFEAGHIEDIIDHLEKPAGKQLVLPQGIIFSIEYSRYLLGRTPESLCPYPQLGSPVAVPVPGEVATGGWKVKTSVIDGNRIPSNAGLWTACFDYEKTVARLSVRSRAPGDRFMPVGMDGEKKIKDYLIDARVPRLWRDRIPVVTAGSNIIWLGGYRIDERFKVTADTKEVLKIQLEYASW